jgi:hypothetical protein
MSISVRLEAFTAMMMIFRVVTPCADVVGYERLGGICCLHLREVVVLEITLHVVTSCKTTNKASRFCGDENRCQDVLGCESDVVEYQCFRRPCCLHLQGEVKLEAARPSEIPIPCHITTWRHNS